MKYVLARILSIVLILIHRVFYLLFLPLMRCLYLLDQSVLDDTSDSMNTFSTNYSKLIFPDIQGGEE